MQARRKIINVVTRDVSKAFDKVWHEGLRYKIQTQYQLNQNSFFFLPTNPNEVENVILSLKSKPTNLNDTPLDVIKILHKPLSIIISYIFNKCIEQKLYPNKLKYARVIPTYKSGIRSEVSHYRPISTLLLINNIF